MVTGCCQITQERITTAIVCWVYILILIRENWTDREVVSALIQFYTERDCSRRAARAGFMAMVGNGFGFLDFDPKSMLHACILAALGFYLQWVA